MVLQNAINGGAIKGSAFWLLLAPNQTAPVADGGGRGLYGIYAADDIFKHVTSNAKVMPLQPVHFANIKIRYPRGAQA